MRKPLHETDVVAMMGIYILHNGVSVTVCVVVSITVDTTGCGLSTDILCVYEFVTNMHG